MIFRKLFTLLYGLVFCLNASEIASAYVVPAQVMQLLELTGHVCPPTLQDVVRVTQVAWLRQPGTERWEIDETCDTALAESIYRLCSSLGYVDEVMPSVSEYDYCCILGATLPRMIDRLLFTEKLLRQHGVKCKMVVFLTGERQLGEHDKTDQFKDLPANETEGMLLAYHSLKELDLLRSLPYIVVQAPRLQTASGGSIRPSTRHTLRAWHEQERPVPGRCLFISNQPFVQYQQSVVDGEMPKQFSCETVGSMADESYAHRPLLVLDTIARVLYQTWLNQLQI